MDKHRIIGAGIERDLNEFNRHADMDIAKRDIGQPRLDNDLAREFDIGDREGCEGLGAEIGR